MKRLSLLGLAALVVLSFAISAAIVVGVVSLWGPSARAGAVLARVVSRLTTCDASLRASWPALPGGAAVASASGVFVDDSDDGAWALVEPGLHGNSNSTIAAMGDHPDLHLLTRTERHPLLWFVRDGDEWVCRDASVVARARAVVEPMRRIGQEMGQVGRQMGTRGAVLGRLGGRLGRLGGRLAALESRAVFAADDERREVRREAAEIRAQMRAISARMRERGDAGDHALRDRMHALERRQHDAVRVARASMRSLIEEVIRDHRAQRLWVDI